MGVKGLMGLLQRFAPGAVALRPPEFYVNKRIAIDASCYLHRFVYGKEQWPKTPQHIAGFYSLALLCQQHRMLPTFVFDGELRVHEKKRELEKRNLEKIKDTCSLKFHQERATMLKALSETLTRIGCMQTSP